MFQPSSFLVFLMWKIFKKWGKGLGGVLDERRNKAGYKYGFVRFSDVKNVKQLEMELDIITIGNTKLFVNIPKYKRQGGIEVKVGEK